VARRYHRHTLEFKRAAVERMKVCASVRILAKELDVQRRLLYKWREEVEGKNDASKSEVSDAAVTGHLRQEVARLKAALADEMMKSRFFTQALQRVEGRRHSSKESGGTPSTTRSES
jgi:hypothetical protein